MQSQGANIAIDVSEIGGGAGAMQDLSQDELTALDAIGRTLRQCPATVASWYSSGGYQFATGGVHGPRDIGLFGSNTTVTGGITMGGTSTHALLLLPTQPMHT